MCGYNAPGFISRKVFTGHNFAVFDSNHFATCVLACVHYLWKCMSISFFWAQSTKMLHYENLAPYCIGLSTCPRRPEVQVFNSSLVPRIKLIVCHNHVDVDKLVLPVLHWVPAQLIHPLLYHRVKGGQSGRKGVTISITCLQRKCRKRDFYHLLYIPLAFYNLPQ